MIQRVFYFFNKGASMILRKTDFTAEALILGMWETLCDMAGVPEDKDGCDNRDDVEIEITKARVSNF
jgi:regulation of enolase protein 1 (concanavalin A-like superfamily)